jgi:DNA-binding XRE family transcriptional regulator
VRRALRVTESADLVVVISQAIYDAVVRHGYGLDPATCRKVRVRVKETVTDAWLHVPGLGNPPGATYDPTHGVIPDISPDVPRGDAGLSAIRGGRRQPALGVHRSDDRSRRSGQLAGLPTSEPSGSTAATAITPASGRAGGTTGQPGGGVVDGPTVRRMLLCAQLRRMREANGITREEAAETIGSSESKIDRMESGRVGFKPHDVAELLTLYGVVGDADRTALLTQAEQANAPGWWHCYADMLPNWLQSYLDLVR